MKQIIYKDYTELSVKTAEQIAAIITEKPDALLCFPAGETSVGTFKCLIDLNKSGKISFKKCRIVGLDEWAHIGEMRSENGFSFMKKHLFNHIDYSKENLCFFDGESADLLNECVKTDDFIRKYGPVDMMLLGIGMNGHLGLNEPGTSFGLNAHLAHLDETTKLIGKKYFSANVELSTGITLGIKDIMEAKTVILQINGSRKAEIAKKLFDSEVTTAFPASVLKEHKNSFVILEGEAARLL
jgi:glucosamine-6-phosphate isomerase